MSRILVVEDEPMVAEVVERYLRRDGHDVRLVFDGQAALDQFAQQPADLMILDLMLPRLDGAAVCQRIRATSDMPIIMLTARGEEVDRLRGLDLGADDYISKPFSPRELAARVRAVLRRTAKALPRRRLEFEQIQIDGLERSVEVAGRLVVLTAREFDLLFHLASHANQVFTREQLMTAVWDHAFAGDSSTVTVHVRLLRAKIEADPARPRHLKTMWGVGYKFEP
ncbi:MAG: response regulator transcription factor [Chloroflexi bacterium]|nr:response regulator transcription factor [Chloroflexota bacterium]